LKNNPIGICERDDIETANKEKHMRDETVNLIAGLMAGVIVTLSACMIYRHIERKNACEIAGGVLVEEKCLDIKQIRIIEK
jgi:hypothetical protein